MNYDAFIDNMLIPGPIEQNVQGKGGIYELLLIQKKSMIIKDYKKKVAQFEKFTNEKTVEQIEELFWKNVAFSPPLYGADFKGSLMDKGVPWNLTELDTVLSSGLEDYIQGVTYP